MTGQVYVRKELKFASTHFTKCRRECFKQKEAQPIQTTKQKKKQRFTKKPQTVLSTALTEA